MNDTLESYRQELLDAAPNLAKEVFALVDAWTRPILNRLRSSGRPRAKSITDPIWGSIELKPWEVLLVDSPLLQRLRGVRQLGLAHLVFPGAGHSRLEHALGVVEAAERMMQALEKNASERRSEEGIPKPDELQVRAARLAALLHDVGHGPLSHVSEPLIRDLHREEFDRVKKLILRGFDGATKVSTVEAISVLIVLSRSLQEVFEKAELGTEIGRYVAALIVGSRLGVGYLSGIVSGPLDADKLDYIACDGHHAGVSVGVSVSRLISKLQVVRITEHSPVDPRLQERARLASGGSIFEIGISVAGLSAFDQMVISRVMLHERIGLHHKVRAATAMARSLFSVAAEEAGRPLTLSDVMTNCSDDTVIAILGGRLVSRQSELPEGGPKAAALCDDLLNRHLYQRTFAFSTRFLRGLELLPEEARSALEQLHPPPNLDTPEQRGALSEAIFRRARALGSAIPALKSMAEGLRQEHVLIAAPGRRSMIPSSQLPTRSRGGYVERSDRYFNSDRWSDAFQQQKYCGYVFCPEAYRPLVALAAKIVFADEYQFPVGPAADRAANTVDLVEEAWLSRALEAGLCSQPAYRALKMGIDIFLPRTLRLPARWKQLDKNRIATELNAAAPGGIDPATQWDIVRALESLALMLDTAEHSSWFDGAESLSESELHSKILECLRMGGCHVDSGVDMAGGKLDLRLQELVVEIKVSKEPGEDPFAIFRDAQAQARRYAMAEKQKVAFVVVAYRSDGNDADLPSRIRVLPSNSPAHEFAEIRLAIPWGRPSPSRTKSPRPSP